MTFQSQKYFPLLLALALLLVACSNDKVNQSVMETEAGSISMQLDTDKVTEASRELSMPRISTRHHDALPEENKINNIQVFFFESGSGNLIWKPENSSIQYNASGLLTLSIPSLDIRRLLSKDYVTIHVVVNSEPIEVRSESEFLNHKVTDIRFMTGEQPTDFIMEGHQETLIEFVGNSSHLAPVLLERLAVKMETIYPRLPAHGIEGVNEYNEKIYYTPSGADGVSVRLLGLTDSSYLGDALSTEKQDMPKYHVLEEGHALHFYSFARTWKNKSDGVYLIYKLRLKRSDNGVEDFYYYMMSINGDSESNPTSFSQIEANHHYLVFPKIEVLGEVNADDPVQLQPQFVIADWLMKAMESSIVQAHYFMLRETEVTMSNIDTYSVKFAASSDVKYKKLVDAWYWAWEKVDNHSEDLKAVKKSIPGTSKPRVEVRNQSKDKEIIISAIIPRDFSPHYFTLEFEDQKGFTERIEVVQYPARYITGRRSEEKDKDPFVYYAHDKGGSSSLDSQNNFNLFTITTLAGGEEFNGKKYRIGDPSYRKGGKVYTREDFEHNQLISPRFVIASHRSIYYRTMYNRSYQSGAGYILSARERCANYAEGGYGVGTWRLPTEAEIEYISAIQNSRNSPVKKLFDGAMYWSAATYRYYIFKRVSSYDGNEGPFGEYRTPTDDYKNDGYYIYYEYPVYISRNASEPNYSGFVDPDGYSPRDNTSTRFYYSSYVRCVRDI